jgi:hypothetical protein
MNDLYCSTRTNEGLQMCEELLHSLRDSLVDGMCEEFLHSLRNSLADGTTMNCYTL